MYNDLLDDGNGMTLYEMNCFGDAISCIIVTAVKSLERSCGLLNDEMFKAKVSRSGA